MREVDTAEDRKTKNRRKEKWVLMRQKTKGKNTHCTVKKKRGEHKQEEKRDGGHKSVTSMSPCVLGGGPSTTANVIIARQPTNIWKSSLRLLLRDTKLQQQIAPIYQRLPLSLYKCTLASFNLHCAQQAQQRQRSVSRRFTLEM